MKNTQVNWNDEFDFITSIPTRKNKILAKV